MIHESNYNFKKRHAHKLQVHEYICSYGDYTKVITTHRSTYFSFRRGVPNKHFLVIHGECLLGMYLSNNTKHTYTQNILINIKKNSYLPINLKPK